MRAVALLSLFAPCLGCSSVVSVERVVAPEEAARATLPAVAIARGEERVALPEGASVAGDRVRLKRPDVYVHKLAEGDVIVVDDEGAITAVQTTSERIEFKPKTAVSPDGSDVVRGELASSEQEKSIKLERGDKIVVRGDLKPGDAVPGGGHVVLQRQAGALVFGSIALAAAYLPAAIAGAAGSNAERALLAPIGGPWAYLVARPACVIDPNVGANCIPDTAARFGAVMSGLFQALGLTFLIVGAPAHAAIAEDPPPESALSVVPMPNGAALRGAF